MMRPHRSTLDRIGACLAALTVEDFTTTELATALGVERHGVMRALDYAASRGWVRRVGKRRRRVKTVGRTSVVWTITQAGRVADAGWDE